MKNGINYTNGNIQIDLDRVCCQKVELISKGRVILSYLITPDYDEKKTSPSMSSDDYRKNLSGILK